MVAGGAAPLSYGEERNAFGYATAGGPWPEYGEARPKPPTLRRRAPKNTKTPSGGWGKAFWLESGSLISVSKSISPPRFWRVPKIGKKRRFDTFFGRFFAFRKSVFCGSHAKTQKMQ